MRRTLIGIALPTVLVAGCQSPVAASRPAPVAAFTADGDLYPVALGRAWSYTLTQAKDGVVNPTPGTMTSRVTLVTSRDGETVARIERTYGSMAVPATEVRLRPDGVVLARWPEAGRGRNELPGRLFPLTGAPAPLDGEPSTSLRILRYPPVAGETWAGRQWTFARESLTAAGWESVTVPAGTFRSWHVGHRIAYDDGRQDALGYWYAAGVGMVKAHEETTVMAGDRPVRYSVDGEMTGLR